MHTAPPAGRPPTRAPAALLLPSLPWCRQRPGAAALALPALPQDFPLACFALFREGQAAGTSPAKKPFAKNLVLVLSPFSGILMSGCDRMYSPIRGSKVKPYTPLPATHRGVKERQQRCEGVGRWSRVSHALPACLLQSSRVAARQRGNAEGVSENSRRPSQGSSTARRAVHASAALPAAPQAASPPSPSPPSPARAPTVSTRMVAEE